MADSEDASEPGVSTPSADRPFDVALGTDTLGQGVLNNDILQRVLGEPDPETQVRLGRYTIKKRLGAGGMGVVYLARDPELDREVALKVLNPELRYTEDRDEVEDRIRQEARAMARLSHPHVVHVHDVGTHEGSLYVAMEFLDGGTLNQWWSEHDRRWQEIVEVFTAAARGLHAAHEAGIVHRDFKPENVLMTREGVPKVTDFGLARVSDQMRARVGQSISPVGGAASLGEGVTLTSVSGTPAYMAPERIRGRPGDARSDQFCFCVSMYEGLLGRRPYQANSMMGLLTRIIFDQREPPPDNSLPRSLWAIIERGLSNDPKDRFPSMAALEAELQRCLQPAWKRHGVPLFLGVVALSAVAGATFSQQLDEVDCEDEASRIERTWSPEARTTTREALLGTEAAYAQSTWERIETELDDWTGRWRTQSQAACEARATDTHAGRRAECLAGAERQLIALVEVLGTADAEMAEQASRATADLADPDRCADDDWIMTGVTPPPPLGVRDAVEAARTKQAKAVALITAGRYEDARALVEQVIAAAEETKYTPLLARGTLSLADLDANQGQFESAKDRYIQAYNLGNEADMPFIAAKASLELITTLGVLLSRLDEGYTWAQLCEGHLRRLGDNAPLLEAIRLRSLSQLDYRSGKLDRSLQRAKDAYALIDANLAADDPRRPGYLEAVGLAEYKVGHADEAMKVLDEGIALAERIHGPIHPDISLLLNDRAQILTMTGRPAEALEAIDRIQEIDRATLPPDHPMISTIMGNKAVVLRTMGRVAEARDILSESLEIEIRRLGPEHRQVGHTHMNLGTVEHLLGNLDRSLELLDNAEDIYAKSGTADLAIVRVRASRAQVLLDAGRTQEALEGVQDALKIDASIGGSDRGHTSHIRLTLVQILTAMGKLDEALEKAELSIAEGTERDGEEASVVRKGRVLRADLLERLDDPAAFEQLDALFAERSKLDDPGPHYPTLRFALARARWKRGEHAPALALAKEVRDTIGNGGKDAWIAAEIDQWLATRPK
ncbi:MAG: serine/threonine-protein kinase [Myxococcota bacterium]